ncbi:MAG: AMP-binding protein [Acidimicrobiia bacterium]|nr:AMP-binding protein [Acidimicrobiia bacterium]
MPDLVALSVPPGPGFVRHVLAAWDAGDAVAPVNPGLPAKALSDLLDDLAPARWITETGTVSRDHARPVATGDALVIATSGTTGRPKGVILTHEAVRYAARITSSALTVDPGSDRWLACLPFFHIGGLSVWIRGHVTGTPISILPGFDATAVMQEAHKGATLVSLVPTTLGRIDPSEFRKILLGGGRMPSVRAANTVATYGLTESGGGVVYEGRPLSGIAVRVVDGIVHLQGPTLARAYRDDSPMLDGDWLVTGDRGELDASGMLTVLGRADDLITTGGETISPEPIEERLRSHASIADVAVVGIPDEEWGEVVTAVVVPVDGSHIPELAELRALVKETRPDFEAPHRLIVIDELPRAGLGKLARSVLKLQIAGDAEADR